MINLVVAFLFAMQTAPMTQEEPARSPQIVCDASMIGMAYGSGHGIYFRASHDLGATFEAPVKVAEAEVVPLGRHRGPRIALSGGGLVVSAVVGKTSSTDPHGHGLPIDGDLVAWRSGDGGKTWSSGVVVNDVPGAAREGLHSLAADSKGRLFAVWLDKRGADGTRLFGAASTDGGISWAASIPVYSSPDGTICQCCHPSVAIAPDGSILVMWRNCLQGARDMYLARSKDWKTFANVEKLGKESWQLNACPMDGGGLAVSRIGRVLTAWRREGRIYLAAPGEAETPVGEGRDATLAIGTKGAFVVWVGSTGIEVQAPDSIKPISLSAHGAYPAIAALADGSIFIAWEEDDTIRTRHIS